MKALLLCIAGVSLWVGCGKEKVATPAASREVAPPPPAVAPVAAPAAGTEANALPVEDPSLAELNRAVNAYTIGMLKEPATLEELVKAGYLKRLPAPPPGKKFVLDARKTSVLVVDR